MSGAFGNALSLQVSSDHAILRMSTEYEARDVDAMIILHFSSSPPLSAGHFGSWTFKQRKGLLRPDVVEMPKIAMCARNEGVRAEFVPHERSLLSIS